MYIACIFFLFKFLEKKFQIEREQIFDCTSVKKFFEMRKKNKNKKVGSIDISFVKYYRIIRLINNRKNKK